MIRRLGNRFDDKVTVIPFVPPPMGGTKDATLIRNIADTCAWLSSRQDYQLSSTMADLENLILKTISTSTRAHSRSALEGNASLLRCRQFLREKRNCLSTA